MIAISADIAITENPKDAISVVGSVTQLSCTASGVSATVVRWKRDNFTLASSSKYLINLKKDGLVVTSNLTITDTQLADSGSDYYCEFGSASVSTLHQSTNAAVLGKVLIDVCNVVCLHVINGLEVGCNTECLSSSRKN